MPQEHYSARPESTQTAQSSGPAPLASEDWRAVERAEVVRLAREFLNNPRVVWRLASRGALEAQGLSHAKARLLPPPKRGGEPGLPARLEVHEARERDTFALSPADGAEARSILRELWAQALPAAAEGERLREAAEARRRALAAGRIANALRTERRGRWLVGDNGEALAESEARA